MLVLSPAHHRVQPIESLPPEVQGAALDAQLRPFFEHLEALRVDTFLASLAPPPAAPQPAPIATTGGPHSDAWWHGVSVCEQGGRDDPFFGYFSIMDGSAGGLSWAQQVGMANGIVSRYGDGAWAASCVAAGYAASPGG
jgi:hypothetical protein